MQTNNSNKHDRRKEARTYIILSLCLIAVGVSGYFFFSGAQQEAEELQPVLSIPVEVEQPTEQTPQPTPPEPKTESAAPTTQPAERPQTMMPVSGNVLQDFAMDHLTYHETTRDWRVHTGVDLEAEEGTSVKAARAGTVRTVYEDDYYGMTVVIDHDDGYATQYSNLGSTAVAEGAVIEAGTVIGQVGQTALLECDQPPHLHFSVTCGGTPVDPAGFLY